VNAVGNPLKNVAGGYAKTAISRIAAKATLKETYMSVVAFTARSWSKKIINRRLT
jgi:hypothetical protein